jgi:hypothetical protein
MRKTWIAIGKAIACVLFLLFIILAFSAFNSITAAWVVRESAGGGFFYEKIIHVYEGLLVLIVFQSCTSFAFLHSGSKLQSDKCKFILKALSVSSLAICLVVYFYSGIFPFSIPTVN